MGAYDDLIAAGAKGHNLTPHHISSANRMAAAGVDPGDAVAINMEHPFPGVGGRHRSTFTYGNQSDAGMTMRDALAAGVRDARAIYHKEGLYGPYIRTQLQQLITENKARFPEHFAR